MSALTWAENLGLRGNQVYCVLPQGSRICDEARARGLAQITVPMLSKRFDPRASAKIRAFVRRNQIDVVQAHTSKDLWVLYPALLATLGVKLFYASHILFRTTMKKDFLHNLIYRRLAGVTVLTEVGKRCFAACTTVAPERITVIPNGFDVRAYDLTPGTRTAARNELGLSAADLAIGCTSRIDVQKGQYELVEAFNLLVGHSSNVRLMLVGEPTMFEGQQYLEFVKRKVSEYKLDSRVTFTGFKQDIPRLLSALDVFVMPSYEEAFGNCLVEAMLSGLPCVTTDAGGAPELVEGGRVGLLAEPKSVESLARALRMLVDSQDLRRDLGAKARESARRRFNLDTVIGKIETLYGSQITSGRNGKQ